jgi:hypothetical protein
MNWIDLFPAVNTALIAAVGGVMVMLSEVRVSELRQRQLELQTKLDRIERLLKSQSPRGVVDEVPLVARMTPGPMRKREGK